MKVDPVHPDRAAVDRAAQVLASGGLVAFPTETVYGLGAAIDRPDALARVFRVKGRPVTDPLIVHVADAHAALAVASWNDRAELLAGHLWPGPLTLVLPRTGAVPDAVTAGGPSVGVRVPAHPVALAVLSAAGVGVAAPSANRFGRVSPTTADHVVEEFAEGVDLILDAGPTPLGIESTVVDLTGPTVRLLRPGGVTVEDLEEIVGPVEATDREVASVAEPAVAPGRFLGHYAPSTPVLLIEGDEGTRKAVLEGLTTRGVTAVPLELPEDPHAAAAQLYQQLRRSDRRGADAVLALMVDPRGIGRAVNDRLFRAAHGRVLAGSDQSIVDRAAALVEV